MFDQPALNLSVSRQNELLIDSEPKAIDSNGTYDYFKIIRVTTELFMSAINLASSSPGIAYDYCVNPSHPWKRQKYNLALLQMAKGVERVTGLSIEEWKAQLAQDDDCPLNLEVVNLLTLLETEECEDPRMQHKNFIYALRGILSSEECESHYRQKQQAKPYAKGVDLLWALCRARFSEIHIYPFCDYLVFKMIHAGLKVLDPKATLDYSHDRLCAVDFIAIDAAPRKYKAQQVAVDKERVLGTLNRWFDPQLSSNLPFVIGNFQLIAKNGLSKPLRLMRIGTPTVADLQGNTTVIAEFVWYVRSCQMLNQRHLYVSLQNDLAGGNEGEIARNRAIKQLALEYPDTFFVVVLPQDTAIYHQSAENDELPVETKAFLEHILTQMLSNDGGFSFPEAWLSDPDFVDAAKDSKHHTLDVMFDETPEVLSCRERQDFIEIYFTYLTAFLMRYCSADNANITCRDGIDRAGKNNSLLIRWLNVAQGHADSAPHQRRHKVLTHAPALLVKKQAIIRERRHRLMQAIAWFDDRAVQARLRKQALDGRLPIDAMGDVIIEDPAQLTGQFS